MKEESCVPVLAFRGATGSQSPGWGGHQLGVQPVESRRFRPPRSKRTILSYSAIVPVAHRCRFHLTS